MINHISYQKKNDEIECVHYKNWTKAYPPHTHAEHLTLGIVEEGKVCIVMEGVSKVYKAGDEFKIPPDVLHEIKPLDEKGYSMLVTCLHVTMQGQSDVSYDNFNHDGIEDELYGTPSELISRLSLQCETDVNICQAEESTESRMSEIYVDFRLYEYEGVKYPLVFYNKLGKGLVREAQNARK